MARQSSPFSTTALLSLAVLLTASVAVPLTKRGLLTSVISGVKSDISNFENNVESSITTTCSGSENPLCLGENVVAAVLSSLLAVGKQAKTVTNSVGYTNSTTNAVNSVSYNDAAAPVAESEELDSEDSVELDNVTFDDPTTTSAVAAAATSAHVSILSKVLSDVKAIPEEVKNVFDDAGLHLLGVYNMTNAHNILSKVETDTKSAIAKVQSFNGAAQDRIESLNAKIHSLENNVNERIDSAVWDPINYEVNKAKAEIKGLESQIHNRVHSAVDNVEGRIHSAAVDVRDKAEDAFNKATSSVDTILHFNSSLGEHLVTSLGNTDLAELAKLVSAAIPGVPNFANATSSIEEALGVAGNVKTAAETVIGDFEKAIDTIKNLTSASPLEDIEKAVTAIKSVASGAGDNLETAAQKAGSNIISWISYNVKSTNGGDISNIISQLSNFNMSSIASEINDFITNDGGFKFCLNPSTLLGSNNASPLAAIGEVFLNTYGAVDSICL